MTSTRITGLGSGMNYDAWVTQLVSVKQDDINKVSTTVSTYNQELSALSIMQTDFTNFQSALETFTDSLSSKDVFNQKAAASSDSSTVSASITLSSLASDQEISVGVSQLATATKANSAYTVAAKVTGSNLVSDISGGAVKAGSLSVYVNNTKYSINIKSDESVDSVVSDLNGITGVSASITNGKLTIGSSDTNNYSISVGSSSDTSNFSNVMSLQKNATTGAYASSKTIFTNSANAALTTSNFSDSSGTTATTQVTAGTFSINGVEFTIDSNTTMNSLVKQITNSSAGVTASWDANSGKLSILSGTTGAVNIDITAGTSNFTDAMGLTSSTWNGDGSIKSSSILSNSQTVGKNALFTINGTSMTSSSNSILSDVSGVSGLKLTLSNTTSSDVKVTVGHDYSSVTSAVQNLASTYNTLMTDADTATGSDGFLRGDAVALKTYRNAIRNLVSQKIDGSGAFSTLSSIGITTGKIGEDAKTVTNQLTVDTDKLTSALQSNADDVKTLLEGNGTTTGILDKMKTVVTKATNVTSGFFTTTEKSTNKKISRLNDKIQQMNENLETYEDALYQKYNKMDNLISEYESQLSTFKSYFGQTTTSTSSLSGK